MYVELPWPIIGTLSHIPYFESIFHCLCCFGIHFNWVHNITVKPEAEFEWENVTMNENTANTKILSWNRCNFNKTTWKQRANVTVETDSTFFFLHWVKVLPSCSHLSKSYHNQIFNLYANIFGSSSFIHTFFLHFFNDSKSNLKDDICKGIKVPCTLFWPSNSLTKKLFTNFFCTL